MTRVRNGRITQLVLPLLQVVELHDCTWVMSPARNYLLRNLQCARYILRLFRFLRVPVCIVDITSDRFP